MTTRQALVLIGGVVLVAVFLVAAYMNGPTCSYLVEGVCQPGFESGAGSGSRGLWYILAGITAAAAVILAFTPWARRKD